MIKTPTLEIYQKPNRWLVIINKIINLMIFKITNNPNNKSAKKNITIK